MKRLFLMLTVAMSVMWASPASALPDCYYARVPVPDGGEPIQIEVCPF